MSSNRAGSERRIERASLPSPTGRSAVERDALSHLVAKRNALVSRLENGSQQIEQLRDAGEDVGQWETFWVRLLRHYEKVCDELAAYEESRELRKAG